MIVDGILDTNHQTLLSHHDWYLQIMITMTAQGFPRWLAVLGGTHAVLVKIGLFYGRKPKNNGFLVVYQPILW